MPRDFETCWNFLKEKWSRLSSRRWSSHCWMSIWTKVRSFKLLEMIEKLVSAVILTWLRWKKSLPVRMATLEIRMFCWLLDIGRDIENHHNDIHTSVHLYLWCFDCNKNFADVQVTLTLSQPHLVFQAAITESQDFGPCWASENKLWSRRWFQIFFNVRPENWKIFHCWLFFQMGWNHQPVIQSWSLSWSCYFQDEWMHVSIF